MTGEEHLGEVIAGYLRSVESGTPMNREELLRLHPDLAGELKEFFDNHDRVERAAKPLLETHRVETLPRPFGRYTLLEEIGRGGMGVVYKAHDPELKRLVAVKMILAGRFASASERERFRFEAEAAAGLNHPNIVPIHAVGEEEGQLYFTMEIMEGGSLEARLDSLRNDPRKATRLLLALAKAVRYALQLGILHRDLKPGNVLLDSQGEPHVTDFGLAKRMDGREGVTITGELVGTLAYMAPEQTEAQGRRLTTAVDIYGLGAILYALLTGRAPFQGGSAGDTLLRVRREEPADPRAGNPRVGAELAAICLKCLEKDPARRYDSVKALADDLENWIEGRPVQAKPLGTLVRAVRWCRRHAALVVLAVLAGAAGMFVFLWVEAVRLRDAKQEARREEILDGSVYTARLLSSVILNRMQEWGSRVEIHARDHRLVTLLSAWNQSVAGRPSSDPDDLKRRPEAQKLQDLIDSLPSEPMVVNWQILDINGVMIARKPVALLGENFKGRDYFKGTMGHAGRRGLDAVHVSDVYHSQADGLDKFDICVPVEEGVRGIGVLAVAITTGPTLGVPHLNSERRKAVLIAPWDPYRMPRDAPPPGGFIVLLHPAYARGQGADPFERGMFPVPFPRDCNREFSPTDDRPALAFEKRDYVDPLGKRDPGSMGKWLAGFAPVGNTGFVVIIQQPEE